MELKFDIVFINSISSALLIVPYGIEIVKLTFSRIVSLKLLIVPYGIEIYNIIFINIIKNCF